MTKRGRKCKITDLGLAEEALRRRGMMSLAKIAEELSILSGEPVNQMNVKRFYESNDLKEVTDQIDAGEDPVDELTQEFKKRLLDLDKEMGQTKDLINIKLQKAVESGNTTEMYKAIDMLNKNWEALRKNWVSIQQFGHERAYTIERGIQEKNQTINILILDFADKLCPTCRKEVLKLIHE